MFTSVILAELEDKKVIVKKFKWGVLGRWLTSNTRHAHELAKGLPGIPTLIGMTPDGAMVLEYVDGQELSRATNCPAVSSISTPEFSKDCTNACREH